MQALFIREGNLYKLSQIVASILSANNHDLPASELLSVSCCCITVFDISVEMCEDSQAHLAASWHSTCGQCQW